MGKTLIFAEKPDQAGEYMAVLKKEGSFFKSSKGEGYYESDKYVITWGYGHMLTSKQPNDYTEFTSKPNKGWSWDAIPFYPPNGNLDYYFKADKTFATKTRQIDVLKKQFSRKDIDEVVCATDAGREGELIFWEVYDYCKCKKSVKRLWISSLVAEDIEKGFKTLRDKAFYEPRRQASYARQYADWMLGHNLTVGFSIKVNMGRALHIGRVQTPTLALLVKRRLEIDNFVPKDFFEIEAEFGGKYKGMWFKDQLGNTRFDKEDEAKAIMEKVKGKTGTVIKKDVTKVPEGPKKLYNLSLLQSEVNKKYGYAVGKTLEIAQLLYEKYKFLSYPRTSSNHLGTVHVPELPHILKGVRIPEYEKFVDHIVATGIKTTKHFVDDSKLSDHHAIIPTKMKADLSKIQDEADKKGKVIHSKQEIKNVYDMVVKRFLSVFYPAAVYEKTEIVTEVETETFKTSGRILVSAGWKEVYGTEVEEEEEEDSSKKGKGEEKAKTVTLPPIAKGETNPVTEAKVLPRKTQPPKHFTEGTLVTAMENAGKFIEDEELREIMKEANEGQGAGLGTEATRAQIINQIKQRGYAEEKGKGKTSYLIATDLAVDLITIAPEELKSPEITADWEQKLMDIQNQKLLRENFEEGIGEFVERNLKELKGSELEVEFASAGGKEVGICPTCKTSVKEKGKAYSCDNDCFVAYKTFVGKKVTETHVKQLIKNNITSEIKGFKKKSGGTFNACLTIKEGKLTFAFPEQKNEETSLKCPECSGKIMERTNSYICENYTTEKPCFAIKKEIAGKKLTDKQINSIIIKGETELIDGFKSKKGTPFTAKIKRVGLKLDFEFADKPKQPESGVKCPFCGGDVTESKIAFGCSNYKECTFSGIWKNSSKKLTIKQIEKLITTKKTDIIDDMVSKKGFKYKGYYELDLSNKKVGLVYVKEK